MRDDGDPRCELWWIVDADLGLAPDPDPDPEAEAEADEEGRLVE